MTARTAKPIDHREYVRIAVDLPLNPKLASLGDDAALSGWLAVVAFCYCGQNLTDGEFIPGVVYRMAGLAPELGRGLIEVGMWHEPGHDCPDCPQPQPKRLLIHDYLKHQRSREEVQTLREKKSAAGTKGAAKRWSGHTKSNPDRNPTMTGAIAPVIAPAMANGWQEQWQTDGRAMAEVEVEVEQTQEPLPAPDGAGGNWVEPTPVQKPPPAFTQVQILVGAYSDAVEADGGISTKAMRSAIGANLKRLIRDDNIPVPVLLVAVQRAGSKRERSVDRHLGAAQRNFDRAGQARQSMFEAWEAIARRIDAGQQTQIGA